MITIDGRDIHKQWTLEPLYQKYYGQLMQYPDAKKKIYNNWPDEDGVDVIDTETKLQEKNITLKFICDNYSKYLSFMNYIFDNPTFDLYDSVLNQKFTLEYISSSEFHRYTDHNVFGIKLRQANRIDTTTTLLTCNSVFLTCGGMRLEVNRDKNEWRN